MAEQYVDYLASGVADRACTPGFRRVAMGATLALALTLPMAEASGSAEQAPMEHVSEFNGGGSGNYYEVTGADASPNNAAIMYVHSNGGVAYKASPLSDEPAPTICPPPASKPGETWESISIDKNNKGYWIFSNLGRVSACGVPFYGEINIPLNGGVVGSAVTATGKGYWFLGKDGGIFSFGDAEFFGSVPGSIGAESLTKNFVDIDATNSGYTIISSTGEQFSFGDAPRFEVPGTNGKTIPEVVPHLNKPIIGQVITGNDNSDVNGSFSFASDGGVFVSGVKTTNGTPPLASPVFHGSLGDRVISDEIVAAVAQPSEDGYWLVDKRGETYPFGNAPDVEEGAPNPGDLPGNGVAIDEINYHADPNKKITAIGSCIIGPEITTDIQITAAERAMVHGTRFLINAHIEVISNDGHKVEIEFLPNYLHDGIYIDSKGTAHFIMSAGINSALTPFADSFREANGTLQPYIYGGNGDIKWDLPADTFKISCSNQFQTESPLAIIDPVSQLPTELIYDN